GPKAVMEMNGDLVRIIMKKNPEREYFIEIFDPLAWMTPYLIPRGPILKLSRQPLKSLPSDGIRKDHEFWQQFCERLIGNWVESETPVKEICNFTTQVYGGKNLSAFRGDPEYVRDKAAQNSFSELRIWEASVYMWRANEAKEIKGKTSLSREAELALRQAYAL